MSPTHTHVYTAVFIKKKMYIQQWCMRFAGSIYIFTYKISGLQQWLHMQFEKSNLTFYTWRDQRPHKTKSK